MCEARVLLKASMSLRVTNDEMLAIYISRQALLNARELKLLNFVPNK